MRSVKGYMNEAWTPEDNTASCVTEIFGGFCHSDEYEVCSVML